MLKSGGTVWAWGFGRYLGENNNVVRSVVPVQVVAPGGVRAFSNVAALGKGGDSRGLVVQSPYATLWPWGDNEYGHLGDGTTTSRPTPVQVNGFGSFPHYCPPD